MENEEAEKQLKEESQGTMVQNVLAESQPAAKGGAPEAEETATGQESAQRGATSRKGRRGRID